MPLGIMINYQEAVAAAARGGWPPNTAVEFWEQVFKNFAKQAPYEGRAVAAYVAALIANSRATGEGGGHVSSPRPAASRPQRLEGNFHVVYHGAMQSNGFVKTPESGGSSVVLDPQQWLPEGAVPPEQQAAASAPDTQQAQLTEGSRSREEELMAESARARPAGRAAQTMLLASAGVAGGVGHVSSSPAALREAEVVEEC